MTPGLHKCLSVDIQSAPPLQVTVYKFTDLIFTTINLTHFDNQLAASHAKSDILHIVSVQLLHTSATVPPRIESLKQKQCMSAIVNTLKSIALPQTPSKY